MHVSGETPNRLAAEASPYLRAHAANPVAWWAYGDEAFAEALRLERPVLLSIGYSSCHWCHVMAHESFEDPETAQLLNENFICVKVDREERPDVDEVAMKAALALSGHGGWPLHVFLTPAGLPFYAGTYFPPEPRYGMPSFRQLLMGVSSWFRERRDEVEAQAGRLRDALRSLKDDEGAESLSTEGARTQVFEKLRPLCDRRNGGWGRSPKFPEPAKILLFLRSDDASDRQHALRTLEAIRRGGITDQVGGGVARYGVDAHWSVPHFEKMLYDNAQLLGLYGEAVAVAASEGFDELSRSFRGMARSLFGYLERDLKAESGFYCAAEDADSEGHEGRFYVFTASEFYDALAVFRSRKPVVDFLAAYFGVTMAGNFEGSNVLSLQGDAELMAQRFGIQAEEVPPLLATARQMLFDYRDARPRPFRDEKCLLGWNALAASALVRTGAALGESDMLQRGLGLCRSLCEDFLATPFDELERCAAPETIYHYRFGPHMRGEAFAEDVGYLLEACAQASLRDPAFASLCVVLAEWFLKSFVDHSGRIFLARTREGFGSEASREEDGVTPAPASMAYAGARLALAAVARDGMPLVSAGREALVQLLEITRRNCERVAGGQPEAMCRFFAELGHEQCEGGVCVVPTGKA